MSTDEHYSLPAASDPFISVHGQDKGVTGSSDISSAKKAMSLRVKVYFSDAASLFWQAMEA